MSHFIPNSPVFFFKHISGLHTTFLPRDAPPEWDWVALMLTVSHSYTPSPLTSWYQFYCLMNRDNRSISSLSRAIKPENCLSLVSNWQPSDPRAETLTTQPTARSAFGLSSVESALSHFIPYLPVSFHSLLACLIQFLTCLSYSIPHLPASFITFFICFFHFYSIICIFDDLFPIHHLVFRSPL